MQQLVSHHTPCKKQHICPPPCSGVSPAADNDIAVCQEDGVVWVHVALVAEELGNLKNADHVVVGIKHADCAFRIGALRTETEQDELSCPKE